MKAMQFDVKMLKIQPHLNNSSVIFFHPHIPPCPFRQSICRRRFFELENNRYLINA